MVKIISPSVGIEAKRTENGFEITMNITVDALPEMETLTFSAKCFEASLAFPDELRVLLRAPKQDENVVLPDNVIQGPWAKPNGVSHVSNH